MASAREIIIRGLVQLVAVLAVVAGLIGWITGWRYGHGLITLGLVVYVATFFSRRVSYHRSMGAFSLLCSTGDDAHEQLESAIRHFRKNAAKRPAEATYLADALTKQWHLLNDAGKHQEALPVAIDAIETWRALVVDQPRFRRNLSTSLNHVGVSLSRLDRDGESIPYSEEAIVVQRGVVAAEETLLAQHLANLSIDLRNTSQWPDALPPAQEAARMYARLVPTQPDLLEIAAGTAEGLSTILIRLDRHDEAVAAAQEQVGYERAHTAANPDRTPILAEAIRQLGSLMMMADRRDDGQHCWRESLELRRQLAEEADEHRPAYAEACSIIAHGLGAVGSEAEALDVFQTGLTVRRELAATDPQHRDDLLTELAQAAFSTRLHTADTEPLAAVFAAEAAALARNHLDSTSTTALTEAADLLTRADFTEEATQLQHLTHRKASASG